jgi:hypothetical protein
LNDNFVIPATQAAVDDANIFATHGGNYLMLGSRALQAYWDSQAVTYAMKAARSQSPAAFVAYLSSSQNKVPATPGNPQTCCVQQVSDPYRAGQHRCHADLACGGRRAGCVRQAARRVVLGKLGCL